jgi:hypothetical protein
MGLIMDPFRDECFTAALGAGAFLNGDAITVGDAAVVSDAVVCTGYGSTGSAGPMLRGTCVCVCVRVCVCVLVCPLPPAEPGLPRPHSSWVFFPRGQMRFTKG